MLSIFHLRQHEDVIKLVSFRITFFVDIDILKIRLMGYS